MKHEIKLEDLKGWDIGRDTLARSSGRGSNKELAVKYTLGKTEVIFEVIENREIVFASNNINEAIEFYNKLD